MKRPRGVIDSDAGAEEVHFEYVLLVLVRQSGLSGMYV